MSIPGHFKAFAQVLTCHAQALTCLPKHVHTHIPTQCDHRLHISAIFTELSIDFCKMYNLCSLGTCYVAKDSRNFQCPTISVFTVEELLVQDCLATEIIEAMQDAVLSYWRRAKWLWIAREIADRKGISDNTIGCKRLPTKVYPPQKKVSAFLHKIVKKIDISFWGGYIKPTVYWETFAVCCIITRYFLCNL